MFGISEPNPMSHDQDASADQGLSKPDKRVEWEQAIAAIRQGLADVEARRTQPARKALKAPTKKSGIPAADK
jgi:hypothetical protein